MIEADFRITGEFRCQPYGNGGWTLSTRGAHDYVPGNDLGAFTTSQDLLAFLAVHLGGHRLPTIVSGDLPIEVIEDLSAGAMQIAMPKGDKTCHPHAPTPPDGYRWRGIGEWFYGPKAPEGVPAQALWTGSAPDFNPVVLAREIVVKAAGHAAEHSATNRRLGDIVIRPAELESIIKDALTRYTGGDQ